MREKEFLIVDDDKWFHSIISRVVEKWCLTKEIKPSILFCANGAEALRHINTHSLPDCILLDIRMPVMDGKAFMDAICSKNNAICQRIIAVTSAGEDEIGNVKGWKYKPAVLINKSFHPFELYEAMDSIINRTNE